MHHNLPEELVADFAKAPPRFGNGANGHANQPLTAIMGGITSS